MAGTKEGGIKASKTNKERYGDDFYVGIGAKGGRLGRTGGFAANPELARIAGAKGGKKSRRKAGDNMHKWNMYKDEIIEEYKTGAVSMLALSKKYNISYYLVRRGLKNEGF